MILPGFFVCAGHSWRAEWREGTPGKKCEQRLSAGTKERKKAVDGAIFDWVAITPRFLHFASRRVRSEANAKKRRRLASVGMTGLLSLERIFCGRITGVFRG